MKNLVKSWNLLMDKNVKKQIKLKFQKISKKTDPKNWMKNPELDEKSKMDGKSKIG